MGFLEGKRYFLQNRHFRWYCEKSLKKTLKTFPKPFQNLQKSTPNRQKSLPNATSNDDGAQEASKSEKTRPRPPQEHPKSIQKASWRPSWTNAFKKLDFKRPENDQEAPQGSKGAQELPRPLPNGAQDPPNPIFMRVFTFYFPTPNLHRFFRYFWKIF